MFKNHLGNRKGNEAVKLDTHVFDTFSKSFFDFSTIREIFFYIDFVSTSLLLMPDITGLHYIVSSMDKNRPYHYDIILKNI